MKYFFLATIWQLIKHLLMLNIAICEIPDRNYGGEDGNSIHDLLTASQAL
jgi:hypothetical protein